MENPIKMDDLGVPLFSETSKKGHELNHQVIGLVVSTSLFHVSQIFQKLQQNIIEKSLTFPTKWAQSQQLKECRVK